jgi:hypothetical protein
MRKLSGIIMGLVIVTSIVTLMVSCKTVDLEPRPEVTKGEIPEQEPPTEEEVAIEELKASIDVQSQIVYVEKPIYIPAPESAPVKQKTG